MFVTHIEVQLVQKPRQMMSLQVFQTADSQEEVKAALIFPRWKRGKGSSPCQCTRTRVNIF